MVFGSCLMGLGIRLGEWVPLPPLLCLLLLLPLLLLLLTLPLPWCCMLSECLPLGLRAGVATGTLLAAPNLNVLGSVWFFLYAAG